jgi:hypothetical protein
MLTHPLSAPSAQTPLQALKLPSLYSRVKIQCKKDNTLCQCSPTSALEKKQMLSRLDEGLRD